MILDIIATLCVLYLIGTRALTVGLDIHDGESVRHWGPQVVALLVFLAVLLSAIWS